MVHDCQLWRPVCQGREVMTPCIRHLWTKTGVLQKLPANGLHISLVTQSYCTALQSTLECSWMDSTPLKGYGQCHCFFTIHHSVILDSLEVIQGNIVPLPQQAQAGWSGPPSIHFPAVWLATWKLWLASGTSLWPGHHWCAGPWSREEIWTSSTSWAPTHSSA